MINGNKLGFRDTFESISSIRVDNIYMSIYELNQWRIRGEGGTKGAIVPLDPGSKI